MSTNPTASWWRVVQQRPAPRLRLFGFHHAGGNARVFDPWVPLLPETSELWALQLPGRGLRLREPPCSTMDSLIAGLTPDLSIYKDTPCVFFGHSMGAHVAFALAQRLHQQRLPAPTLLVVSGARAPHLAVERPMHRLDDRELVTQIRRIGGTPEAVLQDPEMLALTLPVLRADFAVCETWTGATVGSPLPVPMVALAGTQDVAAPPDEVRAWQKLAAAEFSLREFAGGHFFINGVAEAIVKICHSHAR